MNRLRKHGMSNRTVNDKLLLGLVGVILVTAFIAIVLATSADAVKWFNGEKSYEITLTFVFIVVLGGAVATVYRWVESHRVEENRKIERENERRMIQRNALEGFHEQLVKMHLECKRLRRALRAWSYPVNSGRSCERLRFEQIMSELERVQLQAEALMREVDTRKHLFRTDQDELRTNLSRAEKYLRELLRQFEDHYSERRNQSDRDLILLSAELIEFVTQGRSDDAPSETEYFAPVSESEALLTGLIELNTPSERL